MMGTYLKESEKQAGLNERERNSTQKET